MNPQITEEMRQAIESQAGGPIVVFDSIKNTDYVLIRADVFERARPLIEAERADSVAETRFQVPPGIRRSQEAFYRDLPQLLPMKSRKRQWVAYHGAERVGFGRTSTELYQECFRRGLREEEFYVGRVEPHYHAPWQAEEIDPSLYEFDDVEPPHARPSSEAS